MDKIFAPSSAVTPADAQPRFAVFGKAFASGRTRQVAAVVCGLRTLGVEMAVEREFADFLVAVGNANAVDGLPRFDICPKESTIALSIGGDGTILRTAARLGKRQIPILGINTGRLGFLADITPDHMAQALTQLSTGDYTVSKRSLIEVEVEGEEMDVYPFALNEVAVLKHDNSSLIEVETHVDGELLTNYLADGLIVSTPTGSTGYSLSVGGPILSPDSPTFCLAPVAPHSLTMRPVILSDTVNIKLQVHSRSGRYLLAIDGRSVSLPEGCTIHLRKADYSVSVIKTIGNDFFHTLRGKMMWGVDQRV